MKRAADEATPLLRQYLAIKAQHPDHVVFFRCGDFYEMFHDDARLAAQVLGITLTRRGTDAQGNPIALAGVPYHSVEGYLARMVRAGYKVALCEQMENPKHAKGVVRREVVRVVTPGTIIEDGLLDQKSNNYLAGVVEEGGGFGLAALDFSTGEFAVTEFRGTVARRQCAAELARLAPSEVVAAREHAAAVQELLGEEGPLARAELPEPVGAPRTAPRPAEDGRPTLSLVDEEPPSAAAARDALLRHFRVHDLSGFGADGVSLAVRAAALVLGYLGSMQREQPLHVSRLRVYHPGEFMVLDGTTQRSLELASNLTDATRRHTLLERLDETVTAMGGRLLRQWVLQPLRQLGAIAARQEAVAWFAAEHRVRQRTAESLRQVADLERIVSRAVCRTANGRDLVALRRSLEAVPAVRELLAGADGMSPLLGAIRERLDPLGELTERLRAALAEEPPVSVREGGIIRGGYHAPLDELRALSSDSKSWIAAMREKEISDTGIANLKIGFNRVFGYYIEVTRAQLDKVPAHYVRKQTLTGAERFITPELKEKEDVILHAEERAQELEFELFEELRAAVTSETAAIQRTASAVAETDVLQALASAAVANHYCRPVLREEGGILIRDGRHPVLEGLALDQPFVPNDTRLDPADEQILLITGPNMAGKSTYIRQVALITLMAHMGSFVPAREAAIGLVDRIFTRVGAMDQLARGQSTFLVEMSETANILNHATDRSLVILDEVGRGTSTYDGLSIAWSVLEYLHNTAGRRPLTLFATHYHELVDLEGPLARLRNYNVSVLEEADRVAFLYRIVRGSTDRSYGIYAGQVAGLPEDVLARARAILAALEDGRAVTVEGKGHGGPARGGAGDEKFVQLTLFGAMDHPVVEQLRGVDADDLSPRDAHALLAELIRAAKKE